MDQPLSSDHARENRRGEGPSVGHRTERRTERRAGRSVGTRGLGLALGLAVTLALMIPGCKSEPAKPQIPEFPVYEPTEKFLILQDRIRQWAAEIEEKRERDVVLNIIKGRNKFYRAWKPIYDRIEDHKRNPRPRQ